MCETWCNNSDEPDDTLSDYTHFSNIRKKSVRAQRNSGGVTVFVKKSLVEKKYIKRIFDNFNDCIVLLLDGSFFMNLQDIIMLFVYISPENSSVYTDVHNQNGIEILNDYILEIKASHPDASLFLAGDFNSRVKDFLDYIPSDNLNYVFGDDIDYPSDDFCVPRNSKDDKYNTFGMSLIELCCSHSVHLLNGRLFHDKRGEFTCFANNGASVVDYMIASTDLFKLVKKFCVSDIIYSVHCLLRCTLVLPLKEIETLNVQMSNVLHDYDQITLNKYNQTSFVQKVKDKFVSFASKLETRTAFSLISEFLNLFKSIDVVNRKHKKRTKLRYRSCHANWWNSKCAVAKHRKYKLLRKFRLTNNTDDLVNFKTAVREFKYVCKVQKAIYHKRKRDELCNVSKNLKLFWRKIKSSTTETSQDQTTAISASSWQNYFKNLLNSDTPNYMHNDEILSNVRTECLNEQLNSDITEEEVNFAICKIKSKKSAGPDGIGMTFYKLSAPVIIPYLVKLFNEIFSTGMIPDSWAESIIIPIFKTGSRTEPGNYRGISLINALCKIFTFILNRRLQIWCEENNIIHESQAGFRKHYSTTDNVFTLMAMIQKYLSRPKGRFYCIFIDFAKAFDSVHHNIIWDALKRKSINGKFLIVLQSIYRNLKACVRVGDKLTDFFSCNVGTRQGCIGSPLIFCLLMNDLIDYMKNTFENGIFISNEIDDIMALLYADDLSSVGETANRLQRQINCISDYCDSINMKINLNKTKIIVFRKGGPLRSYENWKYKNENIEVVSLYKYLGMFMTPKLLWTATHEYASRQATKAISCIFRYQRSFGFFDPNCAFKLFDSMVKPVLCYGAEIWGHQYIDKIEKVHLKFCRQYCLLPQQTANAFVYGECGRLPLCYTYMTTCVKYWIRILQMHPQRYPQQCYRMLKRLDESGRKTWIDSIKHLLFSYGFGYVWIAQDVGSSKLFIRAFIQRLRDSLYQNWNESLNNCSKADTYRCYKSLLTPEKYLFLDLNYVQRQILARFRTSTHPLMIEKGRHEGIDREYRYCPACLKENITVVESEFHFFAECPLYDNTRNKHFGNEYFNINCLHRFYTLMSSNDTYDIYKIVRFLEEAFKKRDAYLVSIETETVM